MSLLEEPIRVHVKKWCMYSWRKVYVADVHAEEPLAGMGTTCMHGSHLHGHNRTSQYACVRLSPLGGLALEATPNICMHASSFFFFSLVILFNSHPYDPLYTGHLTV